MWNHLVKWMSVVLHQLHAIHAQGKKIMSDIQDLQDVIAKLTSVSTTNANLLKALADDVLLLRTEMAGGQLGPQLQALTKQAQAALDSLNAADTAASTEVGALDQPPAPPVVTPPAPPADVVTDNADGSKTTVHTNSDGTKTTSTSAATDGTTPALNPDGSANPSTL